MEADLLLVALLRMQAAASVAILLILVLRGPARRLIGAELTYKLWAVAPTTAVVSLFPTLPAFLSAYGAIAADFNGPPPALPHTEELLLLWLAGSIVAVGVMALAEALFRRQVRLGRAGPAVMGVHWPRIVTPSDYAVRFTPGERELIGQHERTHIARRDPRANLFIAAMQVISWFNPLVHIAAAAARLDQELACDAQVIQARPACRRDYGATLLKAHIVKLGSPFACAWPAPGRHPLELRLTMLAQPPLTISRYMRGAMAVAIIAVIAVGGVWALAPGGLTSPAFDWSATPFPINR